MAETNCDDKFVKDSRKLSISIYAFLLDERYNKHYDKRVKQNIGKAADCLEKVFKFRLADYVTLKMERPLRDIFVLSRNPIPVKNRIAAESYKRRGNNFMEVKMFKLAEVEYTNAVNLDPGNAICYCNRAASRLGQRSFVDAVKDCEKALELDKNYVKPYCWLGLAYVLMDNLAMGIRYYRKALRMEPNNPVCVGTMELINKKLNHQALTVFEPLIQYNGSLFPITEKDAKNQICLEKTYSGDHVDEKISDTSRNLLIGKSELGDSFSIIATNDCL